MHTGDRFPEVRILQGDARKAGKPAGMLKARIRRHIASVPQARLDYVEFFHPETLQPVPRVVPGTQMALAVFVGATRLIDNAVLRVEG